MSKSEEDEFASDEPTSGIFLRADGARVLLITDPAYDDARITLVIRACARGLPKGSFAVQLRDKVSPPARVLALAAALRAFTTALDVPLIMNGHPDLAAGVGMDGVHFGRDTPLAGRARTASLAWTSVAAHDDEDIQRAIEVGANAALVSPIFDSVDKVGRGVEALKSARTLVRRAESSLQIFALGGIDASRVRECLDAGAYGVAVIRALLAAPDVDAAVKAFDRALT